MAAKLGDFVISTGFLIMLIYANEGDVMQISMQIRSTINMATGQKSQCKVGFYSV